MNVLRPLALSVAVGIAAGCANEGDFRIPSSLDATTSEVPVAEAPTTTETTLEASTTTIPAVEVEAEGRTGKELAADVAAVNVLVAQALEELEADVADDGIFHLQVVLGLCAVMSSSEPVGQPAQHPDIHILPNPAHVTIDDPEGEASVVINVGWHPLADRFVRGGAVVIEGEGTGAVAYTVGAEDDEVHVYTGPIMVKEADVAIEQDGGVYTIPDRMLVATVASTDKDSPSVEEAANAEITQLLCSTSQSPIYGERAES